MLSLKILIIIFVMFIILFIQVNDENNYLIVENLSGNTINTEDDNDYDNIENHPDFNKYIPKTEIIPPSSYVLKNEIQVCPDISKYILKSEIPGCPNMSDYLLKSKIPGCPDLENYILKSEVPTCPNMSEYILKSEIPPVQNLNNYILKTKVPNCPDMSKFILKSEIPSHFPKCPPISKCPNISNYIKKSELLNNYVDKSNIQKKYISKEKYNNDIKILYNRKTNIKDHPEFDNYILKDKCNKYVDNYTSNDVSLYDDDIHKKTKHRNNVMNSLFSNSFMDGMKSFVPKSTTSDEFIHNLQN